MRNKSPKRQPKSGVGIRAACPIRWDALPHQELWKAALESMSFGSRARAGEDARLHVLRRRLPRLDPADHMNYIEIVCAQTVELLRAVRDEYRRYLEDRGAKPLVEMYWVVVRYGVKDWAVMALRDAVLEYIGHCRIKTKDWNALFGFSPRLLCLPGEKEPEKVSPTVRMDAALSRTIHLLLRQNSFDEVMTGGPFGRDGQLRLGHSMPSMAVLNGRQTVMENIKYRQELWDNCYPWTEGLAMLFDAVQEELLRQIRALGGDGRRAESRFLQLSAFHRIAYKHLCGLKSDKVPSRNLGEARWSALLEELDDSGLRLDKELRGRVRDVLAASRKKGKAIQTWKQCYHSQATVMLEDGKRYRLRREVTHAIHNAAKVAGYQLGKVWKSQSAS
jgi:hypothetical protein